MSDEAMRLQRMFLGLAKEPRKTASDRNRRYLCACGARTTKNQMKANGGRCHACHVAMPVLIA